MSRITSPEEPVQFVVFRANHGLYGIWLHGDANGSGSCSLPFSGVAPVSDHKSSKLKLIAPNGRRETDSVHARVSRSIHCPSRSSKNSKVRIGINKPVMGHSLKV